MIDWPAQLMDGFAGGGVGALLAFGSAVLVIRSQKRSDAAKAADEKEGAENDRLAALAKDALVQVGLAQTAVMKSATRDNPLELWDIHTELVGLWPITYSLVAIVNLQIAAKLNDTIKPNKEFLQMSGFERAKIVKEDFPKAERALEDVSADLSMLLMDLVGNKNAISEPPANPTRPVKARLRPAVPWTRRPRGT